MLKFNLEKRIAENKTISTTDWNESLFDVCSFLLTELQSYMEKEGRNFGIVKSYFNSIREAISKFNNGVSEESINKYGSVLFLLKPILSSSFKKLNLRGLSEADSIIVVINKILSTIDRDDCIHKHEVETVSKVIENLWNNIRNKQKFSSLNFLVNTIKEFREKGYTGKACSDEFSFVIEKKKERIEKPVEVDLSIINNYEENSNEISLG